MSGRWRKNKIGAGNRGLGPHLMTKWDKKGYSTTRSRKPSGANWDFLSCELSAVFEACTTLVRIRFSLQKEIEPLNSTDKQRHKMGTTSTTDIPFLMSNKSSFFQRIRIAKKGLQEKYVNKYITTNKFLRYREDLYFCRGQMLPFCVLSFFSELPTLS